MKQLLLIVFACAVLHATEAPRNACGRPAVGSVIPEPADLRSQNGVLKVDLTIRNSTEPDGSTRYCYIDGNGNQSPNLRLKPGDLLILHLKNDLTVSDPAAPATHMHSGMHSEKSGDPCASGAMSATSTNLHFHGLTIPAVCHQDDVVKTSISPRDAPMRRSSTGFVFPLTNRRDCIGIIRTFMDSVKCKYWVERRAL